MFFVVLETYSGPI